MNATRRHVLALGLVATALPLEAVRAATAPRRRLLIESGTSAPGGAPTDAVELRAGQFIDPEFIAALAPGRYQAILSPANGFLLLAILGNLRLQVTALNARLNFDLPSWNSRPASSRDFAYVAQPVT